jgi:hypothetical protein
MFLLVKENIMTTLVALRTLNPKIKAAKTLTFTNGKRGVKSYGDAKRFIAKTYQPTDIKTLASILQAIEYDPQTFIVRGGLKEGVDISKPIRRLKNSRDGTPPTLEEVALPYGMIDVDYLQLQELGINTPLEKTNPQEIVDKLINEFIPELKDVTYYYQLSNTAGWRDNTTIKIHIFFWFSYPVYNNTIKKFVNFVNERAGKNDKGNQLLDPSLYNAAQPHYTAKPILGEGVTHDHLPNRSGLVQHKNAELNADIFQIEETEELDLNASNSQKNTTKRKNTKKKNTKNNQHKSQKPSKKTEKKPTTLTGWVELIKKTENGLHDVLKDVARWLAIENADTNMQQIIIQAFEESARIKNDPSRANDLKNEFDRAYSGAVLWVEQNNIQPSRSRFFENHLKKSLMLSIKQAIVFNSRYMNAKNIEIPPLDTPWLGVIDGDMGTGKTYFLKEQYIEKYGKAISIVAITPRVSLAQGTARKLKLKDYKKVQNTESNEILQLAVCINSASKMIKSGKQIDLLILDESDQTITQLFSDTIDKPEDREELFDRLVELIRNSKHVIISQHLLELETTLFLLKIAGREGDARIHINNYQPWKGLRIVDHTKETTVWKEIEEVVKQNTKIFCPCNSSSQSTKVANFLEKEQKINVLLYNRNTKDDPAQKAFIDDPTEESKKYDAIVCSSSLQSGISIENPDYKRTFAFYTNKEKVASPFDFLQMLFRNRKHHQVDVWIDKNKLFLPTTAEVIHQKYNATREALIRKIEIDGQAGYFYPTNDLTELHIKKQAFENKTRNNAYQTITSVLSEKMGCDLITYDQLDSEQGKASRAKGKALTDAEYHQSILNAPRISSVRATKLTNQLETTSSEHMEMERYKCEKELCINFDLLSSIEQLLYINFYKKGRGISELRAFEMLNISPSQAKDIALYYIKEYKDYNDKHNFYLEWYLRNEIAKSLGISFENGVISYDSSLEFCYDDLKKTDWFKYVKCNLDAVNNCKLGARIHPKSNENKVLGYWIKAMGIPLKSYKKTVCPEVDNIASREEEVASGQKESRIWFYQVDFTQKAFFANILKARHDDQRSAKTPLLKAISEQKKSEVSNDPLEESALIEQGNAVAFYDQAAFFLDTIVADGKVQTVEEVLNTFEIFTKQTPLARNNDFWTDVILAHPDQQGLGVDTYACYLKLKVKEYTC